MDLSSSSSLSSDRLKREIYLKRDEILDLYQSRAFMMVNFECIEPISYHCASAYSETIPENVAHKLYGPNDYVTALETEEANIVLLDGNRCYEVWKSSVASGELPRTVLLNVITDYRGLSAFQMFQLCIYCNYRSRFTKLKTFQEKVGVCSTALAACMKSLPGNSIHVSSVHSGFISSADCEILSTGLHMTTMFDDFLHPFKSTLPYHVWIRYILACVRTCIELKNYPELLAVIEHLTAVSEFHAGCYLHRQFFYDFVDGMYSSCSTLPNMILFPVLAELPYIVNSGKTEELIARKQFRERLRTAIVAICGLISKFISSLSTTVAFGSCSLCSQSQLGIPVHVDGSFCCDFVLKVSKDILRASKGVEKLFLKGHKEGVMGSITTAIVTRAMELILLRTETQSQNS